MPDIDKLTDKEATRLVKFYEDAEKEITSQINRAISRGNDLKYLKGVEKNIKAILEHLMTGAKDWCETAIPRLYTEGMEAADEQIKGAGLRVAAGFGALHQQAINALAQSALDRFENIGSVVGRRWSDIYRKLQLEAAQMQVVGSRTWQQTARQYRQMIADNQEAAAQFRRDLAQKAARLEAAGKSKAAQEIKDRISEKGITGFIDKAGKEWNMTTYTRMVGRTVAAESYWTGTMNRAFENGHDLVRVSDHSKECPKCRPWENKILSISGNTKGYATVSEARAAGWGHPNCRHALSVFIAELEK